ncbi:class I SAM-dependent methyltransferase [Tahibacter caeni]|uniref:class I SAM-dependent methyltransferase n=1 Tax=Tahibacter caeni TaxID=1453545 RepID=UPI002147808D|nr:class I SAM-dependent methyltransferase [Tahibacter caeni]
MDALRAVFAQERAALAPECAGVFGRQGLFIGCDAEFAERMATPMLGRRVGLHLHGPDRLAGDTVCSPEELPFADDSFRLVVLHHAFEGVAAPAALREELVRVLEPGGVALIVGFARFGAWRPWLAWQTRSQAVPPQLATAGAWRRALARGGVDVYAERRIGAERLAVAGVRLHLPPALRSSWLLLARKRSTNALLRSRPVALRQRAARAHLASGTQRASA